LKDVGERSKNLFQCLCLSRDLKAMNCKEARQTFSLFVDNKLSLDERLVVKDHLVACPVCRAELVKAKSIVRGLGELQKPLVPVDLASSISQSLRIEAAAMRSQVRPPLSEQIVNWIKPRLMPYTIGTFASLLFFSLMFMGLRNSLMAFRAMDYANRRPIEVRRVILNNGGVIEYAVYESASPYNYAISRAPFSVESPSLNPHGALAELTSSPYMSDNGDDDMVVVADVFANGIASLSGIIQPPRDPRMVDAFQRAIKKNPAFVPADYDGRPQTIRVVFTVQKVAVAEDEY
jgi:hypothetical protein